MNGLVLVRLLLPPHTLLVRALLVLRLEAATPLLLLLNFPGPPLPAGFYRLPKRLDRLALDGKPGLVPAHVGGEARHVGLVWLHGLATPAAEHLLR